MSTHFDALETRTPEQRALEQTAQLRATLHALKARSDGNRDRLAHIQPDAVNGLADLVDVPVLRKSDLKALQDAHSPFAGLTTTVPGQLRRWFMSPGPIFDPEGQGPDWWRMARPMHAAGFRPGMAVLNTFSYHFTPAAFMFEGGAQVLGCPVIPSGVGNTEMQLQAIERLKPQAYVGTPSFLRILVEKAQEVGADISSLKYALVAAEALPPSLRKWFFDHGLARVSQTYASADLGNIAYESEAQEGLILDEHLLLEIVRPGSNEPLPEGEVGEVVITSLNPDYPLLRFGTGDLSAVLSGASPCGRTHVRIKGWMGRADQTTKVRGMFIHPHMVETLRKRHPEVLKARFVVTGEMARDVMTLHCEVAPPAHPAHPDWVQAMEADIREVTTLRGEVKCLPPGSLPNDGKVIEDARTYA